MRRNNNNNNMDDTEVIEMAAKVFFRNAITQAADNALFHLQSLLGITDGGYHFDIAINIDEHLSALIKDYCDIFEDQRMRKRM